MTDLSKDRSICEAATALALDLDPRAIDIEGGGQAAILRTHIYEDADGHQDIDAEEAGANADLLFLAHFNPARVLQLLAVVDEALVLRAQDAEIASMVEHTGEESLLLTDWADFDSKLAAYLKGSE